MYDVVSVRMKLRSRRMKDLTVFAVPTICEDLTCQPITLCQDSYKHLAGLPLADPSDGSNTPEVDILLGCDYCWSIISGKTKSGDSVLEYIQSLDGYCQGQWDLFH
jgi:hypothetical protein